MKRKDYDKPSMKVVLLQQRTMLLAGSPAGVGSPDPFSVGGDPLTPVTP